MNQAFDERGQTSGMAAAHRTTLEALCLQAGIRARYAAASRLGTRVFFEPGLSGHRPSARTLQSTDLDRLTMLGIKSIWAAAGFFKQNPPLRLAYMAGAHKLLDRAHRMLYRRVLDACERDADVVRAHPLPEYDWRTGSAAEFRERFVESPHPVVLRGFASATRALETCSFARLIERFADEPVLLTRNTKDGYEGRLAEVEDPEVYLHNCEGLFRRHPELLAELELDRLEPYIGKRMAYSQLFIGRGGTGTPFHAAAVWNWFTMVDGRKTWYFVDPRDSVLLYPFPVMGRAASFALCLYPDEYDEDQFPAFTYCPYYTVTLEPGDVLLNPPWWWHAVRNVSETSVGVASRWHGDGRVGRGLMMTEEDYEISPFFSWLFQSGYASLSFMHKILKDPSPATDRDHTLRERNNRFIDRQRELALGGKMRF